MGTEVNAAQETPNAAQTDTTNTSQVEQTKVETPTTKVEAAESATAEKTQSEVEIKYDLKLDEASILDKSEVSEIEAYAKANKLTNEQAQHLLDMKHEAVSKHHQKQMEAFNETKEKWREQVIADKEIGGENFNRNIEYAHRALKQYGSDSLREQLDSSGLGNHPELVRMFARIGQAMSEDRLVKTGAMPAPSKSYEEIFYGGKN